MNIKANTSKDCIRTAGSARIVSRAAGVLGKKADAARYDKLYENIKKAFNKGYVDRDGKITVGWKLDGKKITLDVETPPNTTASIHVPRGGQGSRSRIGKVHV